MAETKSIDCENNVFVTYKRRYVSLILLSISLVISFFQTVQYSSIGYVLIQYYGIGYQSANFTGILTNACFIFLFYPIAKFVRKFGFRVSMLLASFINALGTIIKCGSINRDMFWLLIVGQTLVSVIPLIFLSALPVFAASWFRCKEVANVFGITNAAITVGLLASFLPSGLLFNGDLTIKDMESGLKLMTFLTAAISVITFILIVILVEDKPPTAPSTAELKRIQGSNEFSFIELLRNKNAMIIILCYVISNGLVDIHVVTLSQAVMSRFQNKAIILTISGLLCNAAGIPSSCLTGALLNKLPKYKIYHLFYGFICLVFTLTFVLSLKFESIPLLYLSTFMIGYTGNALIVVLSDYLVEVSYPFPESVSFATAETLAFIPGLLIVPLITYLTDNYDAVTGNYVLLPIVGVNLISSFFINEDLKRTNADYYELINPMFNQKENTF